MIKIEDLPIIEYNERICIKADNGLKLPLLAVEEFTYDFATYNGFPFETRWCRLTLYANLFSYFTEFYAQDTFYKHIHNKYNKAIPLRIYEKKSYFLNFDKWFNKFHDLALLQKNQLLDKQLHFFELKLQNKETKLIFDFNI